MANFDWSTATPQQIQQAASDLSAQGKSPLQIMQQAYQSGVPLSTIQSAFPSSTQFASAVYSAKGGNPITSQMQTGSSLQQYAQIAGPMLGMTPDQYIQQYQSAASNPQQYGSHVQANSQDWQNAVNAWNTGGAVAPQYYGALQQINQYYKQGQAAPGSMNPVLGQQYLYQKGVDASPSGNFFSQTLNSPIGLAALAGGVALGGTDLLGSLAGTQSAAPIVDASIGSGAAAGTTAAATGGALDATALGTAGAGAGALDALATPGASAADTAIAGAGAGTGAGLSSAEIASGSGAALAAAGDAGAGAAGSALGTAASTAATGAGLASTLGTLGTAGSVGALLAGLAGLASIGQTNQAMSQADPFASYRSTYAGMLNNLMANPSSIVSTPGYQGGLQGVEASMAAQGYLGSGNMMSALQNYSGNIYNQQVQTLGTLAGAGISPNAGALLGASQYNVGNLAQSIGLLSQFASGIGTSTATPGLNPGSGYSGTATVTNP